LIRTASGATRLTSRRTGARADLPVGKPQPVKHPAQPVLQSVFRQEKVLGERGIGLMAQQSCQDLQIQLVAAADEAFHGQDILNIRIVVKVDRCDC
jgi:hypothetical protein